MPPGLDTGSYGPPGGRGGRDWLADEPDRAGAFAEPEGRAAAPLPDALAPDGPSLDAPVLDVPGPDVPGPAVLARTEPCALDCRGPDRAPAAVAEGRLWVAGVVSGLNVATDSMAPATRQTARMLASSGMMVPWPANGLVSFCSRRRRRWARSSR
jgi:hypothetical protein